MNSVRRVLLKPRAAMIVLSAVLTISGADVLGAALPGGAHFINGKSVIDKSETSLTVKQSSTTGIIDWKSFSIGKHDSVTFDNGSGATLNRVTGGNLSIIAGSLNASGSLYLMNSSGMIISGTGRVVTGGNFLATSGGFNGDASESLRLRAAKAVIINRGHVDASGNTTLIGSGVRNTGTITAANVDMHANTGEALGGGRIYAVGSAKRAGHIVLISASGRTAITGDLSAHDRGGLGGVVKTSGRTLSIRGTVDAGASGDWLVDPVNLTINSTAAKTIDKALKAGTSVTLKTTKHSSSGAGTASNGPGDIIIDSALSWTTTAALTLKSYHGVLINAPVELGGKGKLAIATSHHGSLSFGNSGRATFANLNDTLEINGAKYTLVDNVKALASDVSANGGAGDYALADNYNASQDGTYKSAPVSGFTGKFEGLGNAISHLTINDKKNDDSVGLFQLLYGDIENIVLNDVSVTGGKSAIVGALVGVNSSGTIIDARSSGTVEGGTYAIVGGLVGSNDALIEYSSASGSVLVGKGSSGATGAGGFVGENVGTISDSFASAAVTGESNDWVGGLVGLNQDSTGVTDSITQSHASGSVKGGKYSSVGGLVGDNGGLSGAIGESYATGTATGGDLSSVGGLVGANADGNIAKSFATGAATGGQGASVGGLAGENQGSISNSYATGSANSSYNSDTGGLVGYNAYGTINTSYSTGLVAGGAGSSLGGLIGYDSSSSGNLTNSYWDEDTSGIGSSLQGAGNKSGDFGVTGLTTAVLQSELPSGFSKTVWAQASSINGGLPYLKALASSY